MTVHKSKSEFSVETPFGTLEFWTDIDSEYPNSFVCKPIKQTENGVTGWKTACFYQSDSKPHCISVELHTEIQGDIDSGECVEALTFETPQLCLTFACTAEFVSESRFDFNGRYKNNGMELQINPNTKSQVFCFGVCWGESKRKDDISVWMAADSFDEWKKYNVLKKDDRQ